MILEKASQKVQEGRKQMLDDTNNEASYEEESTNNDSFSNLENQPFDLYRDDGVDESDETNIDENANDDNNIF